MANDAFKLIDWIRWIWSEASPLDTQEAAVMTVLARRADTTGASYPGIGTICADTKVSRRKVISSIQRLEAQGLIQKEKQRRGNGFDRNHYTVKLTPPGSAPDAPHKAKSSAPETLPKPGTSAPDAPRVVHEMHLGSAQGTLEVAHEVTHRSNPERSTPQSKKVRKTTTKTSHQRSSSKRATQNDVDTFQPSDAHRELAASKGADLNQVLLAFRAGATGYEYTVRGLPAAFTRWLNREKPQRQGGLSYPQRGVASHIQTGSFEDLESSPPEDGSEHPENMPLRFGTLHDLRGGRA